MKKFFYLLVLCLCVASLNVVADNENENTVNTGNKGGITGHVIDESNLGLPGATIYIKSISKGVVTDVNGKYQMVGLPEGKYTVQISYVGFKTIEKEVTVVAKKNVSLDVKLSDNEVIGEVVVKGNAGADLKALNRQLTAPSIMNVISSDQVGRFPDPNIGDALKRIPGIYVQYDQGEAKLVSLRGTDPSKSTININGSAIPGTGDNRAVGVDAIPADMVQAIEVTKALTADMDGDAIGGSINLITRKAPYSRRISATVGSGYNFLTREPLFNGNIIYGDRFMEDKLGVIGSVSIYQQKLGSNAHQSPWEETMIGDEEHFIPRYLNVEQTLMERLRQSYTLGLDYKFNENHSISFTGIFNDYKDWRQKFTLKVDDIGGKYKDYNWKRAAGFEGHDVFDDIDDYNEELAGGATNIILDEDNNGVDDNTGQMFIDYDAQNPTFYPELERHIYSGKNDKNADHVHKRIFNYALEGDHIFGNLKFDWKGSYTRSVENKPERREVEFESENEKTVVMDYSNPRNVFADKGFDLVVNRSDFEGKTSDELRKIDTWYLDGFKGYNDESNVNQYLAEVNFELPINEGPNENILKFGLKTRGMDKERLRLSKNKWYPAVDESGTYNWRWFWEEIYNNRLDAGESLYGDAIYEVGSSLDPAWVGHQNQQYDTKNEDWQTVSYYQDYRSSNYYAKEYVNAAYIMSTQKINSQLTLIGGLRLEQTKLEYEGMNFLSRANQYGEIMKSESDFLNLLPSFHVRYAPTKKSVFRFAYTRTISRPSYRDIVPYVKIDVKYNEFEQGNPDIKPALSNNFDLLGEIYTGSRGLISGGIYFKNIQDFRMDRIDIIPWDEIQHLVPTPDDLQAQGVEQDAVDYYNKYYKRAVGDDFEKYTPDNGGNVNLLGVELSIQQELNFLPGFLRNLTLYSNYTHNWLFENDDENVLPGTAEDILNASLAYETKKINARVSYNYTSSFLNSVGKGEKYNIYYGAVNYVDANVDYFITPKLIFFASVNNLLDQTQRTYQWKEDHTYNDLVNGTRVQFGFKINIE